MNREEFIQAVESKNYKRFHVDKDIDCPADLSFIDNETGDTYYIEDIDDIQWIVDLLNNLQDRINQQDKTIKKLEKCLEKTHEELEYYANLKIMTIQGEQIL